jgi:hypothetical protein
LFAVVPAPAAEDDAEAKKRLEVMRAAVTALEGSSDGLKPKSLTVPADPLLQYSYPTRSPSVLVDAGVWRLGAEGRPTALVTVEFYCRPNGVCVLSYEFLSLTETKFELKHKTDDVKWAATASGLGAVTVGDVRAEFARHKPIVRDVDGRRIMTCGVLAEQKELVRFVRDGRGKCRPLGGFDRAISRVWLSGEQNSGHRVVSRLRE